MELIYLHLKFCLAAIIFFSFTFANAQEKPSKFSISINFGATHSRIKSFLHPGTTEINLPDKTQKISLGYYYGISFNYLVKSRYLISLGINSNSKKIHYTIPEVLFQKSDSLWENANGDIKNSNHSMGIPLDISYFLKPKPNTTFITLGMLYNFYLGTREEYKIYSDADGSLLTSGKEKYRIGAYRPGNFFVRAGVGYKYSINQKVDLSGNLIYNISTGRVIRKDLNVNANHRINFLQIGLSLNYMFPIKK